jgi:tetratricopeptide (TPR) repeat protein
VGYAVGIPYQRMALDPDWRSSKSAAAAIDSIAVLPFVNQNNDSNIDWIADGLTDSITNSLTPLQNLKVIPGLSDTFAASAVNGWISPREGFLKAKIASNKAVQLDDSLAEAHASAGAVAMFYDYDWATAEQEYKRAIELNPSYEIAFDLYLYLLVALGRFDDGIRMAQRGIETAPASIVLSSDLGSAYYMARRFDDSFRQVQKTLDFEPNHPGLLTLLATLYEAKGMHNEAIEQYRKTINLVGRTSGALSSLGHVYAESGRRDEAIKILNELLERSKSEYISPYDVAIIYVGLGDRERAFEQLEKAYNDRAGWMIHLNVEPVFDPIRSDPRFTELVHRMKLSS